MTEQQMLRSDTSDSSQTSDELWRDEIQARVARYRTRRGRHIEGTYSMRFPFVPAEDDSAGSTQRTSNAATPCEAAVEEESPEPSIADVLADDLGEDATLPQAVQIAPPEERAQDTTPTAIRDFEDGGAGTEAEASDLILEPDAEPLPPSLPRPPIKRKVIAFPRQATNQEESYRLADPVVPEQPRILDVPEELEPFPTTPLLEGLQLSPTQPWSGPSPEHIELPFQAASLSRRTCAGMVDLGVVLAASGVFGAVALKLTSNLERTKPLLLAAAAAPLLLWAIYEYILMMYGGATLGMQVTKMRLSTFKGGNPGRRHRRSRVISLYFSTASLMMGLLWSLVDVDALCWHDRISHTYLTQRE